MLNQNKVGKGKPMGAWLQWFGVLWYLQKRDPTITPDTFDLRALIDPTLTLPENCRNIQALLKIPEPQEQEYQEYEDKYAAMAAEAMAA